MVKKKKEIKIVRESDTNYTFLNAGFMNTYRNSDSVDDITNKTMSNIEKDALKARPLIRRNQKFDTRKESQEDKFNKVILRYMNNFDN
jgi:hypothetical protein